MHTDTHWQKNRRPNLIRSISKRTHPKKGDEKSAHILCYMKNGSKINCLYGHGKKLAKNFVLVSLFSVFTLWTKKFVWSEKFCTEKSMKLKKDGIAIWKCMFYIIVFFFALFMISCNMLNLYMVQFSSVISNGYPAACDVCKGQCTWHKHTWRCVDVRFMTWKFDLTGIILNFAWKIKFYMWNWGTHIRLCVGSTWYVGSWINFIPFASTISWSYIRWECSTHTSWKIDFSSSC